MIRKSSRNKIPAGARAYPAPYGRAKAIDVAPSESALTGEKDKPLMTWRRLRRSFAAAVLVAVSGCGASESLQFDEVVVEPPDTQVYYTVETVGAPSDTVQAAIESSLLVYTAQERGAPSTAHLSRRIENDLDALDRILRAEGYYEGETTYRIEPIEATGETDSAGEDAGPSEDLAVVLEIDPGPRFRLAAFEIAYSSEIAPLTSPDVHELGLELGAPAVAEDIVDAETRAIAFLHRNGRPYAARADRQVTADMEADTLSVNVTIDPGPEVDFGPVTFSGVETIDTTYLDSYRPWQEGELVDRSDLAAYQRRLSQTGLFNSVSVRIPEAPPPTGIAPVTISVEERKPRSFGVGVRYSTDLGPVVRFIFEHRNLLGANEQLRTTADVGLDLQSLATTFRKPQYLRDRQDLVAGITLIREEDDAFDQTAATGTLGLERELTPRLRIGAGGLAEAALTKENGEERTSYLLGLPAFVAYDSSDDILHPTTGLRSRMSATPFGGLFDDKETAFFVLDGTGSTYWAIDQEARYIFAVRGRAGSILGAKRDRIPPQRRLYAGGGGSVRGFENRFVGPLDGNDDPQGGRSVLEAGVELRTMVTDSIGVVPFVEAGSVSKASYPDFEEGIQVAAGLGLRYFTPVGPVRLDVAVPLNRRDADDSFQFYISIGQAF